jgi:predicted GNAT family acetyltransferase
MIVRRHATVQEFLARAETFLLRSEAENNLMLSAGLEGKAGDTYFATVEDRGEVVASALRTPPRKVILSRANAAAVTPLVTDLIDRYADLPAALGPEPTIREFAKEWSARTGVQAREGMRHRLYETSRVLPLPRRPPGRFRIADEQDVPILTQWATSFIAEVNLLDHIEAERVTRRRIAAGALFVWEDGAPVSMASWAGRTPNGVRVGFVYTPDALRGRGYASACVADLTEHLLGQGLRFCCLVTDLANPTSNSIYQRIGYQPVCDLTDFVLDSRSGE